MGTIDLIYCAGSNPKFMQIAHEEGFLIGIRSDKTSYQYSVSFLDVDYKRCLSWAHWEKHLERIKELRPKYATVPDLSECKVALFDILRAIRQVQQAQEFCEIPFIIPKLPGQIQLIPNDIAVAYSIPTSYGGARFGLQELTGRKVHLLGGNPKQQQRIARWVQHYDAVVISADGNMPQKAAQKATYWDHGWKWHERSGSHERDLMYECFRRSMRNIVAEWHVQEEGAA